MMMMIMIIKIINLCDLRIYVTITLKRRYELFPAVEQLTRIKAFFVDCDYVL